MNRNNYWRLAIVILVVVWSFVEMYPPVGGDLGEHFKEKAVDKYKDAAYTNILEQYQKLQKVQPEQAPRRAFADLLTAIGTNDITRYFPQSEYAVTNNEDNPSREVLNRLQKEIAGKIRLGLDLQGGTSFLVEMDTNRFAADKTNGAYFQQQALSQAVDVIERRVNKFGVAEPMIQPAGNNRILIQLPGLSDADKLRARQTISNVAFLEFKLVLEDSDKLVLQDLTYPGYEFMRSPHTVGSQNVPGYLVKKNAELTGDSVASAYVGRDSVGRPQINFTLTSEGASIFGEVTRNNIGRELAIVLDGKLESAPVIKTAIEGGSGEISGHYSDEDAQRLANVLQNPLKVPVMIVSETSVDPTLGADTVKSGVRSAIIGTLAVAGFMVAYYLLAGAVADMALILNIIILLGVMCAIPATFTLPGIAGIVLTIGMAVDANVLIFERIREETAKGKSLRGALAAGYDRAFGTIFDSHVTTLISSIILIYMGSGPIKGFGVTLTIGVAASLFTALVVTRLIFDFLIGRGLIKTLPMLHIIRATKLDFMKLAKPAFILSWTIILIGMTYGIFGRGIGFFGKDNMLGIDFKGGDNVTLSFSEKVETDKIRQALKQRANINEPVIQYQKGTTNELLSITSAIGTGDKVLGALTNEFPNAGFGSKGSERVGATIGGEIQKTAIIASLVSLLGILLYVAFRYEFYFAVGAVVAVLHDVLMTIGCYCLTGLFHQHGEGRQFNATMMAAVLTIIGFSINDTIVIFDRIREDLKLGVRGSFKDLINQALNQTLSRTIITSGTVFIATTSLYLFGGGAINDFAFTFLIGIITGTYSSIYIASALVLWFHKGARPKTSTQVSMEGAVAAPRS
jgi:SecD/SecF fusion protein